jgi:5'-3' exonuclease
VTHLAVATDTVITSFRNEMFEGYKTGEGIEADLVGQFHLADRIFSAMGVVLWDMIDFEADDALATAAARWADDVEQVVILTPDKDMAQCVIGERVVTYDRRNQKMYGYAEVVEKFGVEPESIPDYLALVGDTADGVPGLPGWGAKSSSVVLKRYGHLESIPASADDWDVTVRGASKLADTLVERREDAMLYRELTRLRVDVPLPESLEDLEWRGVKRVEFLAMCDELGFGDDTRNRPHRWQ